MPEPLIDTLIARRYREVHDATFVRSFDQFMASATGCEATAALGYRSAATGPLFLESYLNEPVEQAVSRVLARPVVRDDIVELGNLAASNGLAMIELWGRAANDLAAQSRVAVATLTAPVRAMFARVGVPIMAIAPALPQALGDAAPCWGSYYDRDPVICAGMIADGQNALNRYFTRRQAIRTAARAA